MPGSVKQPLELSPKYTLEHADSKHRTAGYLAYRKKQWEAEKDGGCFFSWLDAREHADYKSYVAINDPALSFECWVATVRSEVTYYNERQRKQHQALAADGRLFHSKSAENETMTPDAGRPVDTRKCQGKCPGYAAFVIVEGGLYLTEYSRGHRHHSSMVGTKQLPTEAGMIKVVDGKVVAINNFSGHYCPNYENLYSAICYLEALGVLSDELIIDGYSDPFHAGVFMRERFNLKTFGAELGARQKNPGVRRMLRAYASRFFAPWPGANSRQEALLESPKNSSQGYVSKSKL